MTGVRRQSDHDRTARPVRGPTSARPPSDGRAGHRRRRPKPVFVVEGLNFFYGQYQALRDVSLTSAARRSPP